MTNADEPEATVKPARNCNDATRQRLRYIKAKLAPARAEDEETLTKLTQAVTATLLPEADLKTARTTLSELTT